MRLELPVRWTESDKETEKLAELTDGKISSNIKYSYGKLSIDSEDIGPYYDIDDRHTMINDRLGKLYCITVPFHDFKKIYTEVSGKAILAIQTSEEYKASLPKRRKGGKDNKSDDMLNE